MSNATITQPLNLPNLIAESTQAGTAVTNLNTDYLGTCWQSTNTTGTYLTLDFGSATTVDVVAFLSCLASAGTTIRIRAATTMANTTTAPTYDSGVLTMFLGTTPSSGRTTSFNPITSTVAQFWRVDIADHPRDFQAS